MYFLTEKEMSAYEKRYNDEKSICEFMGYKIESSFKEWLKHRIAEETKKQQEYKNNMARHKWLYSGD